MNFTPAELFAIEQLQQKMLLKLNQVNACKQKEASEHEKRATSTRGGIKRIPSFALV